FWYRFTADSGGVFRADVDAPATSAFIAVYTGSSIGSLSLVVCDNQPESLPFGPADVVFRTEAEQTYYVQVADDTEVVLPVSLKYVSPPANDEYSGAESLTLPSFDVSSSLVNATADPGDPMDYGTIWYKITSPIETGVYVSWRDSDYWAVGASFFTLVNGSPSPIMDIPARRDRYLHIRPGVTYLIRLAGLRSRMSSQESTRIQGYATTFWDNYTVSEAVPLTFPAAIDLNAIGYPSDDSSEPVSSCLPARNGIWFRITPSTDEAIVLNANGNYRVDYTAYRVDGAGSLVEVACHGFSEFPRFSMRANAGITYYIKITGGYDCGDEWCGYTPLIYLHVGGTSGSLPPNDDFSNATAIPALPFSATPDLSGGSSEPGEPLASCDYGGQSIWYSYHPDADRGAHLTIKDHYVSRYTFMPSAAVFVRNDDGTLKESACGTDLYFRARSSQTYYVQIAGNDSYAADLDVGLAPTSFPANDDLAEAKRVDQPVLADTQDTLAASVEPGEPRSCTQLGNVNAVAASIWYRVDVPIVDVVTVNARGALQPVISVFKGTGLKDLVRVGCDATTGAFSFGATAGTYYIQVGGFGKSAGTLNVNIARSLAVNTGV
ncbi:MAG: hypothetical protein LC723_04060, partial [Actinobacteria bacterium]|nr:hypothetical protein [Actinomycetota bacterium]